MKLSRVSLAARSLTAVLAMFLISTGCQYSTETNATGRAALPEKKDSAEIKRRPVTVAKDPVSAAVVMSRVQVPILCYHQIRNWRPSDSKQAKDYIVPETAFAAQIKMLADSGYHSISANQLYNYLTRGTSLPSNPIMLTFDDTDLAQYTIAKPAMEKYGFKGMFFIMTVSLGRPNYMSRAQVKELSDAGHEIGSHTWDHKNIKKYTAADWVIQIDKPTKTLESITGKPIQYFAYPFGLWNNEALTQLKQRGFLAAFQLSAKRNETEPLYTIRRMIVPGAWTPANLHAWMKHSF
ncbi:MAG: polysaccharide deacetylase family protein [Bacteroidota bacterium]